MSELASLLEILGQDATLKLIEAYGGTRVLVPVETQEKHVLRELLGDAGFALLVQYFGGILIAVPMARKWRFDVYAAAGLKPRQIARKAGCTEAAVYAHQRARACDKQMAFGFSNDNAPPAGAKHV